MKYSSMKFSNKNERSVLTNSIVSTSRWNYSAQHKTTSSSSVISQNQNDDFTNKTFAIVFKKGDHYPTIIFPLGNFGELLFPAIITAYLFLCLTIVCDCFLVPCVQGISTRLEWNLDVAGVTLLAAASSSPEMFINILATFLTKSDVGVGTILGTGLFALFLVPALCILLTSRRVLKVDCWPIIREITAYLLAMIALVTVLADEIVEWYEACCLIAIYFIYLIVLKFNDQLQAKFESCIAAIHRNRTAGGLIEPILPLLPKPGRLPISMSVEDIFYVLEDHTPDFYTMTQWPINRSLLAKIEWVLMWPIITLMRMTIPTFWYTRLHYLFILTFAMCVAWIGVLSYCISWMITILGNRISLPESVMGLTLIAAGMSIPETISGVIVSNQGYETLALCNAFGSNTFAILICLGVPWLIEILFFKNANGNRHIILNSKGVRFFPLIVVTVTLKRKSINSDAGESWMAVDNSLCILHRNYYLCRAAIFLG
ncbi:hypothetical protein PGB90_007476 [Kerria lacca]